ncbi:MAG: cold shock domain-containing protein [Rubrobacteraceae bacterium]
MTDSKKRIALKPHMKQIREWVDQGKSDDWIADALGTSASSVQSFRSRNDIYRRERSGSEPESVFEGVLDHGERDGWGMWFDPQIAEDPIWREHWTNVESVVVKVAEDSIVLEIDRSPNDASGAGPAISSTPAPPAPEPEVSNGFEPGDAVDEGGVEAAGDGASREKGRVKWFDPDKGYGFLVRPTGDDLFVHHSEVEGDPGSMEPNGEVEYEVGQNDRGPNARRVRPLD